MLENFSTNINKFKKLNLPINLAFQLHSLISFRAPAPMPLVSLYARDGERFETLCRGVDAISARNGARKRGGRGHRGAREAAAKLAKHLFPFLFLKNCGAEGAQALKHVINAEKDRGSRAVKNLDNRIKM